LAATVCAKKIQESQYVATPQLQLLKPRGKHVAIVYQQNHVTTYLQLGHPINADCL